MTALNAQDSKPTASSVTAMALRLSGKVSEISALAPSIARLQLQRAVATDVLVEIRAAAINPSDAKAAIGMMPYAIFPRTPGRDFAGVVIDGPQEWIGREVFGSSGDLGIRRDGTHATHLVVESDALVEKPASITSEEAAGIGVPFVTAQEGFRRSGMPRPGETVLILGLNGKVGQAAAQIAAWRGASVIGAVRKDEPFAGEVSGPVAVINSGKDDVAAKVRELTNGKGVDIVYNTVGEPYYEAGQKSLAILGRMIFIAAFKQTVPFDIFAFYRGRHTYVGIDTLSLSSVATGEVLRELQPGFASGHLRPFPILPSAIFPLTAAKEAYAAVLGSSRDRMVFRPSS
jgi:NADPH:quinone reductase